MGSYVVCPPIQSVVQCLLHFTVVEVSAELSDQGKKKKKVKMKMMQIEMTSYRQALDSRLMIDTLFSFAFLFFFVFLEGCFKTDDTNRAHGA